MDPAVIRNMFEVNVLGMMVLTQQVAIQMAEQKHGHIINVASIAGKIATPKTAVYSATKFAVLGFSNALRLELKPLGINVTTVNRGRSKRHSLTKQILAVVTYHRWVALSLNQTNWHKRSSKP